MKYGVRHIVLLLAVLVMLGAVGSATQVSLGESNGQVKFTNEGNQVVDFNFTGNCGVANCLSGFGLFGSHLGTYKMWITGGSPQLMVPNVFDIYPIDMAGSTIHFTMVLSGGLGVLNGDINFDILSGGSTKAPEFIGGFTATSTSGLFSGVWPLNVKVDDDFTVSLSSKVNVDQVYKGIKLSVQGPLSSGEILSTPEPTSLGLLGSGLLTMVGFLKRRI